MPVFDTIAGNHRLDRYRLLAGLVLGLCLVALGLRALALFTVPQDRAATSELTRLAETLTGPGLARVIDTGSGSLVILIDGPETQIEPALSARLTRLVGAASPDRDINIDQFPFARGVTNRPSAIALGELAALGLAASLAAWLVLTLHASTATPADMIRSRLATTMTPLRQHAPEPDAPAGRRGGQARATDRAADLAAKNPARAAAVIRGWLREKGETP